MSELEINEQTLLATDSDGNIYNSVGRLTGLLRANSFKKIHPYALEKARQLGEEIDTAITIYHDMGELPKFREGSKEEKLFNQYLKFISDYKVKVIDTQILITSKEFMLYGYADVKCVINGKTFFLEVKTRNTKKSKTRLADYVNSRLYTVSCGHLNRNSILLELSKDEPHYRATIHDFDTRLHLTDSITNKLLEINEDIMRSGFYKEVFNV